MQEATSELQHLTASETALQSAVAAKSGSITELQTQLASKAMECDQLQSQLSQDRKAAEAQLESAASAHEALEEQLNMQNAQLQGRLPAALTAELCSPTHQTRLGTQVQKFKCIVINGML